MRQRKWIGCQAQDSEESDKTKSIWSEKIINQDDLKSEDYADSVPGVGLRTMSTSVINLIVVGVT